jgi:molecular chaperone GrpE
VSNPNEETPLEPGEEAVETFESSDDAHKLAQSQEALAYLAAEFENYKRQTTRRIDEERARAKRRVLETIFPAIDNFNLAIKHAGSAKDVASFQMGLEYIGQQLETALAEVGLSPIESVGQTFDPAKHDALEEIESEGQTAGTILEETQRGYTLDGQVLRPSRVKVAK